MRTADFYYDLPPELIAQHPVTPRSASRLLHLERATGALSDHLFRELPTLLRGDELFVFNDTRVIPARLFGTKEGGGGRVEVMLERILSPTCARVQLRCSKPARAGQRIHFDATTAALVQRRRDRFYELELAGETWEAVCVRLGHTPLPPYIRRTAEAGDDARYQTVFARVPGAVAAPTAGLHFDAPLLQVLQDRGVEFAFVTLHVGAGTFQPVQVEDIAAHQMHSEYAEIPEAAAAQIERARQAGRAVIAVGTTVVRTLEAAATEGGVRACRGEINSFIYPGYEFKVVRGLITNFHLPESTLLMLVSALAGLESTRAAYRHAVTQRYRFFSYGDAMFIR